MPDPFPCPVAELAREIRQATATYDTLEQRRAALRQGPERGRLDRAIDLLSARILTLEEQASQLAAISPEGALAQIAVALAEAEHMRSSLPGLGTLFGQASMRRIEGLLYSAAGALQTLTGSTAEALLGGWYLPPAFDPHRQLAAVMTHAGENARG